MHAPFNPAIPCLEMYLTAMLTQLTKDARTRLFAALLVFVKKKTKTKKTRKSLNIHQALNAAMNICSAFLTGILTAKFLCFSN